MEDSDSENFQRKNIRSKEENYSLKKDILLFKGWQDFNTTMSLFNAICIWYNTVSSGDLYRMSTKSSVRSSMLHKSNYSVYSRYTNISKIFLELLIISTTFKIPLFKLLPCYGELQNNQSYYDTTIP